MTGLKGYHAHVYYDPATRPAAERLHDAIISQFAVKPGAFSDEPIGPHPISQFSVIFETDEFQKIVPWLMLNREGLDVLVHPLTEKGIAAFLADWKKTGQSILGDPLGAAAQSVGTSIHVDSRPHPGRRAVCP